MSASRRLTGFQPLVAYSRLVHAHNTTLVLYFDDQCRCIGWGKLLDEVSFRDIPNESARTHPDQVVDPVKFFARPRDTAILMLNLDS